MFPPLQRRYAPRINPNWSWPYRSKWQTEKSEEERSQTGDHQSGKRPTRDLRPAEFCIVNPRRLACNALTQSRRFKVFLQLPTRLFALSHSPSTHRNLVVLVSNVACLLVAFLHGLRRSPRPQFAWKRTHTDRFELTEASHWLADPSLSNMRHPLRHLTGWGASWVGLKAIAARKFGETLNGRDGQIRTADPSHPKRVLYQAEPRPDTIEPARASRLLGFLFSLH